jgi:hypothetical protein
VNLSALGNEARCSRLSQRCRAGHSVFWRLGGLMALSGSSLSRLPCHNTAFALAPGASPSVWPAWGTFQRCSEAQGREKSSPGPWSLHCLTIYIFLTSVLHLEPYISAYWFAYGNSRPTAGLDPTALSGTVCLTISTSYTSAVSLGPNGSYR